MKKAAILFSFFLLILVSQETDTNYSEGKVISDDVKLRTWSTITSMIGIKSRVKWHNKMAGYVIQVLDLFPQF